MKANLPAVIEYADGVTLSLSPKQVYIEYDIKGKEVLTFADKFRLMPVKDEAPSFVLSFNSPDSNKFWYKIGQDKTVDQLIQQFLEYPLIRIASPVYYRKDLPGKTALTFSDIILVKVEAGTPSESVNRLLQGSGEIVGGPVKLHDGDLYTLKIKNAKETNAIELSNELVGKSIIKEARPNWIQLSYALHRIPNDTHYSSEQWALRQIGAPDGWDTSTGAAGVIVGVLDTGCDLVHEDLSTKYVPQAERYDALSGTNTPTDELGHGTCLAGIIAADSDNNKGVAGVAWNCSIMPIRVSRYGEMDEMKLIDGIRWAINHHVNVLNMCFEWGGPSNNLSSILRDAYDNHNIVLIASVGNKDINGIPFPANHPLVIGVGASDQSDRRKDRSNPDGGQNWGSNFGLDLSMMAPGVSIWSTDIMNIAGFNSALGPSLAMHLGLNTSTYGPANGNYISIGNGTSSAAPFVAGSAALLLSRYPSLSNGEVREIIEKTAEKVGGYVYSYDPSIHPNGTWNIEMGHGRINIARALNFAETYIKDSPADKGRVPFTSEPFWDNSDIVIRQMDDNRFDYEPPIRGQQNYVYVRVTNNGPADARNIQVNVRTVAYIGTEFVYPDDWSATDSTHIRPTDIQSAIASLSSGGTFIAKFSLSIAQTDALYGWHPCILAEVHADNDYGIPVAGVHSWEHNNLAQRNLSLMPIVSVAARDTGAQFIFPFIMGHRSNKDPFMELAIEIPELPQNVVQIFLDPFDKKNYFPALDGLTNRPNSKELSYEKNKGQISILKGGQWYSSDKGTNMIALKENKSQFKIDKNPGELYQMVLKIQILNEDMLKDKSFEVKVSQISHRAKIVGGASFYFGATNEKR